MVSLDGKIKKKNSDIVSPLDSYKKRAQLSGILVDFPYLFTANGPEGIDIYKF